MANGEVRCIDSELPFELPKGWEWVRLKDVVFNHGQKIPDKRFSYIDIGSIDNKRQRLNEKENIIEAKNAPSRARKIVEENDIIYSTVRPYLHNLAIIDKEFSEEPIASTGFAVFSCCRGLFNKFLFFYLLSPDFDNYANDGDNAKGVAYPAINDDRLYKALIPIPPFAEQHRIVTKLEELVPFIEKYNMAQNHLDTLNDELNGLLKKSILQEAIQGKLVPQCDTDEPASKLLERIKDEKRRLVKAGKLKAKDIVDSVIFKGEDNKYYEQIGSNCLEISEEIPFSIPENWKWCRLKQVCFVSMGQSPDGESVNRTTGVEFHQGKIQFGDIYLNISDSYTNKPTKIAEANSLLLCVRAPVGILNITKRQICIGRGLCSINPYYNGNILLWFYFLSTYRDYFEKKATGSTFKAISNEIISNTLIPLPPMGEQQRIVERIQELYSKL